MGVRRVRLERGWTIDDMAVVLGCDKSRISRIENGTRGTPDPAVLAGTLGVSLDYLLMPGPRCGYEPLPGYMCLRCGTRPTAL